jgi:hypothetical protein
MCYQKRVHHRETSVMNKIVREFYPASKLPEDLRSEFPVDAKVTVTVETETASAEPSGEARRAWLDLLARIEALPPVNYDPDRVSKMRDEWEERDPRS